GRAGRAAHPVDSAGEAARAGYRGAAVELKGHLPPHAIEAVLDTYRQEGPRLVRLSRSIEAVERALRGDLFTARRSPQRVMRARNTMPPIASAAAPSQISTFSPGRPRGSAAAWVRPGSGRVDGVGVSCVGRGTR